MTEPLTQIEKESILTLSLMAAFADGGKSEVERAALKRVAENFPESDVNLAALYSRVLVRQVSTTQAAQALTADPMQNLLGHHWHHLPTAEVGQLLKTNLEAG